MVAWLVVSTAGVRHGRRAGARLRPLRLLRRAAAPRRGAVRAAARHALGGDVGGARGSRAAARGDPDRRGGSAVAAGVEQRGAPALGLRPRGRRRRRARAARPRPLRGGAGRRRAAPNPRARRARGRRLRRGRARLDGALRRPLAPVHRRGVVDDAQLDRPGRRRGRTRRRALERRWTCAARPAGTRSGRTSSSTAACATCTRSRSRRAARTTCRSSASGRAGRRAPAHGRRRAR